jgi:hypothetical protein
VLRQEIRAKRGSRPELGFVVFEQRSKVILLVDGNCQGWTLQTASLKRTSANLGISEMKATD